MRITLLLTLLLLIAAPAVKAQQRIYRTLGAKFKGLRQDQVKISSSYYHEATFMYHEKKYKVLFNPDSTLYCIEEIKINSTCPSYISKDLSCFYEIYKVEQWEVKEYFSGSEIGNKDTLVYVSISGKRFIEQLVYHKGEKPIWSVLVEKHGDEYWGVDEAYSAAYSWGDQWYGGSIEAFADSLEKYMIFSDKTCINRFNDRKVVGNIFVGTDGKIMSYEIRGLLPYIVEDRFSQFFGTIKFPANAISNGSPCCRYKFEILISNGRIEILPFKLD